MSGLLSPDISRSKSLLARSDELLVRGCQGHKRSHEMIARGYPVFTREARGARFTDANGNEYIDYLLAYGPILLGHCDPVVQDAISAQMAQGTIYTTAWEKEVEVAEKLIEAIPFAEMLGFVIGGSAATAGAVLIARSYTGKDRVIRSGYHGWHDWARPGSVGVPEQVSELTVEVPYADLNALDDALGQHPGEYACVVMETVRGEGPPEGFLEGCVEVAHSHDALCVFDEIKVGFRVAYGGAGHHWGVTPDMSTFGKACCNGYPGSFIAGRKEVLGHPKAQEAWLAATFHCDTLSLTAMATVLDEMEKRDGIAYQWEIGQRLIDGLNAVTREHEIGYRLVGPGPMPTPVSDPEDAERVGAMLRGCLARGIYLHPGHPLFFSLAHSREDIDHTIAMVAESAEDVTRTM